MIKMQKKIFDYFLFFLGKPTPNSTALHKSSSNKEFLCRRTAVIFGVRRIVFVARPFLLVMPL
jgi:hypothetical protein